MEIHIGKMIKAELKRQGRTVKWFQQEINRSRSAVYEIFRQESINTELLAIISIALNHDFFKDISEIIAIS